jgi:HEAT repeat protein
MTVAELFEATLQGDYDDEAAWSAVRALQLSATPEVLEHAMKYCRSADPKARARGLDVLAQLGAGKPDSERPYLSNCVSMAVTGLADQDPLVVHSAAWALMHLPGDRGVAALIEIKNHQDAGVRKAVACGMEGSNQGAAIQTLIELIEDPDDDVRDWATFELGTQCDADSPEIREALRKRLDDSFGDARSEAIWGLARRKDHVGLRILMERLESETWIPGDAWAAEEVLGLETGASREELLVGLRELLGQ